MIGGRSKFLRDPGTFWHTVVGERIFNEGFTRDDAYSFTRGDREWIPHQWLGEVAMAMVHRISGFDGQLLGTATLLAALFAAIGTRWLRTGLHPIACVMVVGLTLAASATHFHIRPHLLTIVGTAVTMWMLIEVERRSIGVARIGWLVPFYLIWINTHGGVLGGMVMLGLAGLGWTGLWLLGKRSPIGNVMDFLQLAGIGIVIGLSIIVTPYGIDIAKTWLDIMNAPMLPLIIEEHRALEINDPTTWPLLMIAVLYMAMLLWTPHRHWTVTMFLPLFWLLQAFLRVRHAPLFAVVAALAMAEMLPVSPWFQRLSQRRPDFVKLGGRSAPIGTFGLIGILVWFACLLGIQSTGTTLPIVGRGWATHDPQLWPMDMLPILRDHQPDEPTHGHIFNEYIDGGFLIYHCPNYRVFIDDRCELYGDQWIYDYVQSKGYESTIADWQREYGDFNYGLTRIGSDFDHYFREHSETWKLIRESSLSRFYKRKE